ncbi:MAG: CBS domain-containing protein, partial [Myxococcales bacterium]|nr:CBS domain-containing protein [Myxococcales bacterium]
CRPDDSLDAAARIMSERDCGCVPVVESNGSHRLVGMITDRDICLAAHKRNLKLRDMRVDEAMSSRIYSCSPGATPAEVEELMRSAQVRRIPIVDSGQGLLGMVSLADLARLAEARKVSERRGVTEHEVTETLAAICQPRAAAA